VKEKPTYREIREMLSQGSLTCEQLVEHYLGVIRKRNGELNAFLETYDEEAVNAAREIDRKIKDGTAGKLAGMVIGLKDTICYKGHKVSASSKILEGFESLFSATAVERLIDEDAIIIGRLNCDEFAMGSSNENSAFGPVRNPVDTDKVPGGSSGGSVSAVAAGMCTTALGSDTGGSIRQPASFTGLVGLKGGYGRVSRHGLIAYASSFDQIGPVTLDVYDAALVMEVIAGPDEFDSTASQSVPELYSEGLNGGHQNEKRRIAVISECYNDKGLDPEIREHLEQLIDKLRNNGHVVDMVSFPYLDLMVPTYYVLTTAEASSNLSRYGGVAYGYRSPDTTDIDSAFRKSRSEGFGEEVKRRIMLGTFVLSAGFYDAYYNKAQKVRRILKDRTEEIFEEYDFILSPSTPVTAFSIGDIKDPVTMYLQDIYTVQATLAGVPAISIPTGNKSDGLPFGTHVMAPRFKEWKLLQFSDHIESIYN
jgi:aspartyl-tRNA(Asn)/glutamyl-tRNA(Gln) amidotransferase subunit A